MTMSNAHLPYRALRPQADGSFHVIIDTHREMTQAQIDSELEHIGYLPEYKGRRPLGEPVAEIKPSPMTYIGTGGADFQMYELVGDGSRRFLADGYDPVGLAKRLADGEFDHDFRFEYVANPEPDQPSDMYFISRFATPSQQELESFTTDDPGREIGAARYCQTVPLEERWAADAEAGR